MRQNIVLPLRCAYCTYPPVHLHRRELEQIGKTAKKAYGDFTSMQGGYWQKLHNQRAFLEHVADGLGIKEVRCDLPCYQCRNRQTVKLSGWYSVSRRTIGEMGGWRLLQRYSSVEALLRSTFPDYPWDSSRFRSKPEHSLSIQWADLNQRRDFFHQLGKRLGVEKVC